MPCFCAVGEGKGVGYYLREWGEMRVDIKNYGLADF